MRTIVLGFDSFDPAMFQRAHDAGRMINLKKLVDASGYTPLEVCSPPQTEVSWTSIATGVDPGSHGIFDFVHRDPETYAPYVSILPTKHGMLGEQFVPPYITKTFFQEAAEMGTQQRHSGGLPCFQPGPRFPLPPSPVWELQIFAGSWAWAHISQPNLRKRKRRKLPGWNQLEKIYLPPCSKDLM